LGLGDQRTNSGRDLVVFTFADLVVTHVAAGIDEEEGKPESAFLPRTEVQLLAVDCNWPHHTVFFSGTSNRIGVALEIELGGVIADDLEVLACIRVVEFTQMGSRGLAVVASERPELNSADRAVKRIERSGVGL
jgi:hypothetical protein